MHRGPMAAMARRPLPGVDEVLAAASSVLVLDGLVDHTNVGAAFRSAAAMGIDAVLVTHTCADPLYRRSVRVSMGTVFQLPWTTIEDLDTLSAFAGIALTPDPDAEPLAEVVADLAGERIALVVGTEGPGLDQQAQDALPRRARIPMANGVDSLNVAAAVAVACYELMRTRSWVSTEAAT
jgi:tRNA G18 (ribose-2'-O)-methylase SpoU